MFKKLRIQFISIVMASVAIVLAIVFTGICVSEYQRSSNEVNEALSSAINRAAERSPRFDIGFGMGDLTRMLEGDAFEELGDIWRRCAFGQWWEASFLLLAFGGLRVGESLAVTPDDICVTKHEGVSGCVVHVRRQVMNRARGATDKLKNPQSKRVTVIPGKAGTRLLTLACKCDGWLSGDGFGNPNTQDRLNRAWVRAIEGAEGLERHPLRNLRNSFETNARWVLKMPPWVVEPMLGHAGRGVTEHYYDRPNAEMIADTMLESYASCMYDVGWTWTE